MKVPLLRRVVAILIAGGLAATVAYADIYTYTDKEGVVHFTNIEPKAKDSKKWTRVYGDGGSKKAAAQRGACERCDVVPSQDTSPERFARYDEYILEAAELYQIPVPLIRAVIKVESDYDPRVVSSMGARGLMQLMPEVCQDMHVKDPHEPRENILGGTRLLRVLANRYDGDLVLTIAAYHSGMGSLAKYHNTVPPYEYTQQYLQMVLKQYYRFKELATREP
jgi:soluble lytic murein transglycosylase-like protein